MFEETLASIAVKGEGRVPKEGIIIADTQKLFSAWAGVPYQTGLSKCCEVLKVSFAPGRHRQGIVLTADDAFRFPRSDSTTPETMRGTRKSCLSL